MTWDGNGRALPGRCKSSCCKTPYGHSAGAVDCHCHDRESESQDALERLLRDAEESPRG